MSHPIVELLMNCLALASLVAALYVLITTPEGCFALVGGLAYWAWKVRDV